MRCTAANKRTIVILLGLWILSIGALLIAPFLGLTTLDPRMVFSGEHAQLSSIFWQLRVPRVLSAWIIGAVLALSGMCFQAMLKNPLAEPFTLGIASGSALGASLYIHLGLSFNLWMFSGVSLYAFMGALMITSLVYYVSRGRLYQSTQLLLMGVILSFFCSSIIMFMQAVGKPEDSLRVMQWMMGMISLLNLSELKPLALIAFIGTGIIILHTPKLNLLNTGHVTAITRGINPSLTMGILYFTISLMLGVVISVSGPIGFVGLIVPHVVRRLIGQDHRVLWLGIMALGGLLLVLSDLVSRWVLAPSELPVGVITAILGAPFFLWILLGGKKQAAI